MNICISFVVFCYLVYIVSGVTKLGGEAGARPFAFVDYAKRTRAYADTKTGDPAPLDENGWPKTDFQTVAWDQRPYALWKGTVDDPEGIKRQPDMSGVYKMSFMGKATISGGKITNQVFNETTFMTTADLTFGKAPDQTNDVLVLEFTNTQRNATSGTNTGITNYKLIAPGYDPTNPPLWTKEFLKSIEPFGHLRFMGWKDTNYKTGYYGDQGHHLFTWDQRTLPTDSPQGNRNLRPGAIGISWEHILLLANEAEKSVWINIPVTATGGCNELLPGEKVSYLEELANLFGKGNEYTNNVGLKKNLKVFLEHSNEVWNFGFSQYTWNKLAAVDEVTQNPNDPIAVGCANATQDKCAELYARRRHAKCVVEIGKAFSKAMGSEIGDRVIPIFAEWTTFPDHYNDTLQWVQDTYGTVNKYISGLAQTHYFGPSSKDISPNETVADLVEAFSKSSDGETARTQELQAIAKKFNIRHTAYEAGPGWSVGSTVDIANVIMSTRDSKMKDVVVKDIVQNWWNLGADEYNYFTVAGSYSRDGQWGATDLTADLTTSKYQGVVEASKQG